MNDFKRFDDEMAAEAKRMAACRVLLEGMGLIALLFVVGAAGWWVFN